MADLSRTQDRMQLAVNYTDSQLRALVEEYIMQQKSSLSLKGACDYVLYWAIEEGSRDDVSSPFEGTALHPDDQERVKRVLDVIAKDGRIAKTTVEGKFVREKN